MGTFLLAALGVAAGYLAGTAGAKRMVRREIDELRGLLEAQRPSAAPAPPPAPAPSPAPAPAPEPAPAPAAAPAPVEPEEIPAEVLTVLTAAVAAFLGKKARIRGVRRAPIMSASAWAQQGRVFVQASHNLQRRGF
jgi:hypothetical protein